MSTGSAPTTPAAAARLLSPTAAQPPLATSAPSQPSVMAARNEAIEWRSVVLTHKVTLEHAAVDIDTDRVLYHMELEFETPLPPDVMQHAQFLCLTWPYGGLWKIERVSDNNSRVKCLSWRKTDLTRQQVDELAKQVDALAIKVEADEGDGHSPLTSEELHDQATTAVATTTMTTPTEPPQEDLPTLFEWKMMRGEWNDDVSHWFLRSVDPPVPASASATAIVPTPLAKRDLIAKLFVDFDPLEARIEVNAVTAIDTVAQTYSADVTWQVTLPAITALREDSVLREFLDILEIDASQFEFTNISEMNDQRELMSSVTLAGDAEFRDLTQPGSDGAMVENVYNLQFSRRVIATFTEEMALHSFPFDQQKLVFEFSTGNSGMANTALRLTPTPVEPGSFSIDNYQLGNVFDVAYHNKVFVSAIQETGPKKSIAFEMVLERRSAYYLTNVALIAAVITYLCFVTYAPVGDGAGDDDEYMDTGSRLQIVTALVLTAVTFKNQVASLIPQVSYFTTLDKYVFFCFMVTSLVTLENALFPLYRKLVTQGTASENGLLGFSIGMFTLVNVAWSLYLRRWYNRRRIAAGVLLQVHEYIRVITETIPPKYREDVLRRFLVHKNFEDWCIPAFVVTSNGDVHIQAPDDVPQDEDFATKATTVAAITQQKQEAMSEQNTFKKIYLDLRPGLDRRASAPVASSPISHGVFTGGGGGGSRVNEKKPFVVDRSLSGNAMELTAGGAGGRRSHSANTYFHESSVDVQHPFHRHRNGSNKRSSTRRAL